VHIGFGLQSDGDACGRRRGALAEFLEIRVRGDWQVVRLGKGGLPW